MAGNFTFFTNDSGSAAGPTDYIRDEFLDVSLPANNNTSLTSNINTNPLSQSFANTDAIQYGPRTLWIKDLVLLSDRSQWIKGRPTYQILWSDTAVNVLGYVFGNFAFDTTNPTSTPQPFVQFRDIGDGIGINGIFRKVAFIVNNDTAATATGQLVVDGSNTTTIDFSSLSSAVDTNGPRYSTYVHSASNETLDLHDFRLTALQVNTLKLLGVIVYSENASATIATNAGTTYVDKSKITTTAGSSLSIPSYGSSLGGKSVIYKTQSNGYAQSAQSCSTVISLAQGTNGTNLMTLTTGTGASFPAGSGLVVAQGTSMYVGSVRTVSTDTLTLTANLPFGISNTIYRSWLSGPSLAINASFMQLSSTIDFSSMRSYTTSIFDPQMKWAMWGSNYGVTLVDSVPAAFFAGASGFLQVDGYFSGADIETIGGAIFHATLAINGLGGWSQNAGQTGSIVKTVFSEAGPGWNSFVFSPGASHGAIGIAKINLYGRRRDVGVTTGMLAEFETLQSMTERTAINASLMTLGTYRRYYAPELYLKGHWAKVAGASFAGGAEFRGSSTSTSLTFQYYGQNFAILGTAAAGTTVTLDGVGVASPFNALKTVASEGFHTLAISQAASMTTSIQAIDVIRSKGELKSLQNTTPLSASTNSKMAVVEARLRGDNGAGGTNTTCRQFTSIERLVGNIIVTQSAANGDSITILSPGYYQLTYDNAGTSGRQYSIAVNATALTSNPSSAGGTQYIGLSITNAASLQTTSVVAYLDKGDVIRTMMEPDTVSTLAAFSYLSVIKLFDAS